MNREFENVIEDSIIGFSCPLTTLAVYWRLANIISVVVCPVGVVTFSFDCGLESLESVSRFSGW